MKTSISAPRRIKRLVSLSVTGILLLLFWLNPFWMLEYRIQDYVYQQEGLLHPDIAIIGIDDRAWESFGPFWQWGRDIMADAIQILNADPDAKPAVIAIDILYSEPGIDTNADDALIAAVREADNVVLASLVFTGFDNANITLDTVIVNYQPPFPALRPHVGYGLANGMLERDGFIRNALLSLAFEGENLYSFPLVTAKYFTGKSAEQLVGNRNESFISYTGLPGDFKELSFADIFEPDFDPWQIADRIVLIGPYTTGMGDHFAVPISHGEVMYGVEIHANVLQMILEGNFKQRISDLSGFLIAGLLLIVAMVLGELLDIRFALVIFFAAAIGYFFFAVALFNYGYVLPLLSPPLAVGAVFLYQLIYSYILQRVEKAKLRNVFQKYVDPKLVDALIDAGEADSNEIGRKKHIAVLFVDVRGFTPMTEALRDSPEHIVETLNEYLELTSTAVFNNGGSVDKFIGDATMALFNGFVPLDDYVFKAVKAAWDMVEGAEAVNASIKEKLGLDIGFGIGVHCGEAIVGNLGPSFRKDYTAIGDVVNTAARMEAGAGRSQVLISRDVYEVLKERITAESVGEIPLKGKSVPLEMFSLTGIKS